MKLNTHKIWISMGAILLFITASVPAQEPTVTPPESIVADGVPKIPASLVETAGRYGAYRSAGLTDWSPVKREMLIATPAASAFAEHESLLFLRQIGDEFPVLRLASNDRADGHLHEEILPVRSAHVLAQAVPAALRAQDRFVPEAEQIVHIFARHENHTASPPAVAAVRPAFGRGFLATEAQAAVAASARVCLDD